MTPAASASAMRPRAMPTRASRTGALLSLSSACMPLTSWISPVATGVEGMLGSDKRGASGGSTWSVPVFDTRFAAGWADLALECQGCLSDITSSAIDPLYQSPAVDPPRFDAEHLVVEEGNHRLP